MVKAKERKEYPPTEGHLKSLSALHSRCLEGGRGQCRNARGAGKVALRLSDEWGLTREEGEPSGQQKAVPRRLPLLPMVFQAE